MARRAAIALIAAALALPGSASALPCPSNFWQDAPSTSRPASGSCRASAASASSPREPLRAMPARPFCDQRGVNTLMGSTDVVLRRRHRAATSSSRRCSRQRQFDAGHLSPSTRANVTTPTPARWIYCSDNLQRQQRAPDPPGHDSRAPAISSSLARCSHTSRTRARPAPTRAGQLHISALTNDQRAFPEPATGARGPTPAPRSSPVSRPLQRRHVRRDRVVPLDRPVRGLVNVTASRFNIVLSLLQAGRSGPRSPCSDGSRPDDPLTSGCSYVRPAR